VPRGKREGTKIFFFSARFAKNLPAIRRAKV